MTAIIAPHVGKEDHCSIYRKQYSSTHMWKSAIFYAVALCSYGVSEDWTLRLVHALATNLETQIPD